MSVVFKLKRSETASSTPDTSDLEVGEVALNTADKALYVRDSSDNIVQVANFSASDPSSQFPSGDLGNLTDSTDAFGQTLVRVFDCLDTPNAILSTENLGAIS